MADNQQSMLELAGVGAVSVADIANISMDGIDEVRQTRFPKGIFLWKVHKDSALTTRMAKDKETQKDVNRAIINIVCECVGVQAFADPSAEDARPEKWIGKNYFENFWLKPEDPQEAIGQFKAFAADIGVSGAGYSLQTLIDACKDMVFIAKIVHRRNQDDEDNPFVNLDRTKIRPYNPEAQETAA